VSYIIPPRRDEQLIRGDKASQRYIKFFEQLSDSNNDSGSLVSFTVILSDSTYTTTGNSTIICTVPATITLNASPDDLELVVINNTNGLVTVKGGGQLINGESEIIQHIDDTSLGYFYSSAQNEWFIQ